MNIGDKIPEILGMDQDGKEIKASDYRGRKSLLVAGTQGRVGCCRLRHYWCKQRQTSPTEEVCRRSWVAVPSYCRHRDNLASGARLLGREGDMWT